MMSQLNCKPDMGRGMSWSMPKITAAIALAVFTVSMFPTTAVAQAAYPPSLAAPVPGIDRVEQRALPALDFAAIELEDRKRETDGLAPRFAIPVALSITPTAQEGSWDQLDDGRVIWRNRIHAPEALSVNLGFIRFHLPPTAEVWIYDPTYQQVLGPFTDRDNDSHRQLWTPVILGDEVVVELAIRPEMLPFLDFELGQVGHGYTGFGYPTLKNLKSGSCNLDVICGTADGFPEVEAWRDEIRSVAVIGTGGSTFCTGFLVNNVDGTPTNYFMTADHCGIGPGNAASFVAYWNYENSTCRTPGSSASGGAGDGSLAQFNTGSFFRAGNGASDFTLIELDDPIDPTVDPYFAGMDATNADATMAVGIHHPSTDEKRISFENDPTATSSYLGTSVPGDGTHVWVDDWDLGTTEGGSSGSPVFDQNHRVIGQLHGGYAACGNDDSDWYGRTSVSWTGAGTTSTRLSDWLDPSSTGNLQFDGRNLCTAPTFDFTISPNPATANQPVTFDAINVIGTGPYNYAWDFNGDGITDCTTDPCVHAYTAYYNGNVTLAVTDISESCTSSVTHAMVVNAPSVVYVGTTGATEICGDGDAAIEPGEEWSVELVIENVGNLDAQATQVALSVQGDPATVELGDDVLDVGVVTPGAQAAVSFSFLVDATFEPCGTAILFDMDSLSWNGGANPGELSVFTANTGGVVDDLVEDFEDPATWAGLGDPTSITDQWVVTTGPGAHSGGEWTRAASGSQGQPASSTGFFAVADSDEPGSGSTTSTILWSPVMDMAAVDTGTVTLEFDAYFRSIQDNEFADVDVFDGSTWQNLIHWTDTDVDAPQSIDVTAHALGNPDFRVRFSYQDATWDWWFAIDNLVVNVEGYIGECDNTVICGATGGIFADGFEGGNTGMWSNTSP
jgi:PKD domain